MLARKDIIDWGARLFGAPARSRLRCGHLLVEFSRGENEVCLASKRLSDEEADAALDRDEPVSWTSWAVCTGAKGVKVLPGLPDLPVLARQDSPFRLLPGEETRVYLRIPVSVKVCLGERDDELLAEFPSETMPRVWFGEAPADDELSLAQTAAWETYCVGRLGRLGISVNQQRWRYNFRNRHGFTDSGDGAFDRLWASDGLTWGELDEISRTA